MFPYTKFQMFKCLSHIVIIEVVGKLANDVVSYRARSMYKLKSKYKAMEYKTFGNHNFTT